MLIVTKLTKLFQKAAARCFFSSYWTWSKTVVDRILMTTLTIRVFLINSLHILRCLSSVEWTLLIVVTVNELFESFAIEVPSQRVQGVSCGSSFVCFETKRQWIQACESVVSIPPFLSLSVNPFVMTVLLLIVLRSHP